MKSKKRWVFTPAKKAIAKLSDFQKAEIEKRCQTLVEQFKQQYIKENPDKRYNYLADVYTKWRRNYLYFCQKFKSESLESIVPEFEENFVRLEYLANDNFNFSYFRHTGQWFPVAYNLSLNDCLEMIAENPNFHPIG
ncbi:MAG: hypothetical protein FD181_290 [Prolixibacteraceae bacterium]|nr:MAG: hypothetical protein FD181_290 [Prolixibacteraceae bacterium]